MGIPHPPWAVGAEGAAGGDHRGREGGVAAELWPLLAAAGPGRGQAEGPRPVRAPRRRSEAWAAGVRINARPRWGVGVYLGEGGGR